MSLKKFSLLKKIGETHPKSHYHTIKFSASQSPAVEVSSSYLQKCGILCFLPEERSPMRIYLFYFPGVIETTQWKYNVVRGLILTEITSSSALYK